MMKIVRDAFGIGVSEILAPAGAAGVACYTIDYSNSSGNYRANSRNDVDAGAV